MKIALLSAALAAGASMVPAVHAAGNAEDGGAKAQTCLGCHGAPGMRNAYPGYKVPKLGGQHEQYLVAALQAYKNGQRAHPTMQVQAEDLSDQDMADIAAFFTSLGGGR
jgi:cytochrome c553